jgi:integrase
MAVLQPTDISPLKVSYDASSGTFEYAPTEGKVKEKVPFIYFDNGDAWFEANRYASAKFDQLDVSHKTVRSNMGHLKHYASWLEDTGVDWRHFPTRKRDRCIFLYRGHLIRLRDTNQLAPSTTTARMSAVVAFYRWCFSEGLIDKIQPWEDRTKIVKFYNSEGFNRTMQVRSSELAIPNRQRSGLMLEDGLTPISKDMRDTLLSYLRDNDEMEMLLMFTIIFCTGARSETIRTLRIQDIENAIPDPLMTEIFKIKVGPPTTVKTKFSVPGDILFAKSLLKDLKEYFYSPRRLQRQQRAKKESRTILFLTTRGNPYSEGTFTKLISELRKKLVNDGLDQFKSFYFHQARATFGTTLMEFALKQNPDKPSAIGFVRDAMLHKDEETTWRYIKFVEQQPLKNEYASEFFDLFTGRTSKEKREQAVEDFNNS